MTGADITGQAGKGVVRQSLWVSAVAVILLIYDLTVRDLRTEHRNAAAGILISISQPILSGLAVYIFMNMLGTSSGKIRGDDLSFIVLGFIFFFLHIRTAASVAGSLRGDMLAHNRLSPFLLVAVKACSTGYKMTLALLLMLLLNYLIRGVFEMQLPLIFILTVFASWIGGVAVGVLMMAANRYLTWGGVLSSLYTRVMFITSGKFFVANQLPGFIRPLFDWNPLFHLLDQNRSAAFQHYTARTTSLEYPLIICAVVVVLAALVAHYVKANYSESFAPA
ncbi:MAG: ABC transporter permease [Pseudomonadota bacterium]